MRCRECGNEYESKYYFVTPRLCKECFEKLNEEEQAGIVAEIESLSTEGAAKRVVDGHELTCAVCGHDEFWKRKTLMNTPGFTLMGIEWANKEAENYVCDTCGHVLWFLREVAG